MDRAEFGLCVIILCLGVPKLKILSVRIFQELFVGTVLDYFSAVENKDPVAKTARRKSVRYIYRGFVANNGIKP